LLKTQALAYDTDVFVHTLVLSNRRACAEKKNEGFFLRNRHRYID
jgi:hypothetical protein